MIRPGIGESAMSEQLAGFVAARGGLVGHYYPEGSAGVPYQPFAEAFESYPRERDTASIREELGSSASGVAQIVPSLSSMLEIELAALENPNDDRLRLLSGILDSLRTAD